MKTTNGDPRPPVLGLTVGQGKTFLTLRTLLGRSGPSAKEINAEVDFHVVSFPSSTSGPTHRYLIPL